jgi:ribonuclease P protein component
VAKLTASAGFQSHERIRRREEFQRVYAQGSKTHGRFGILFLLANGLTVSRLGIAATRKFGGSVARNRAKRLIRDVFRRNKIAPGFDVVVVPKRALLETSLSAFEAEFRRTLERRVRQ